MKKTAEKIKEVLTNIEKDSITDNESALAVFQTLVKSVDAEEVGEFVSQTPVIKSFFDRKETTLKTELKNRYEAEIANRDSTLAQLKEQMPRERDPEKIKQQLEATTDPTEKRLLQLELNNVLIDQKYSTLQAEKDAIEKREREATLKAKLAETAKAENLPIHDASLFATFGERAEEVMREFAMKNNETLEARIKKMAEEKFGGAKMDGANSEIKGKEMSADQFGLLSPKEQASFMSSGGTLKE